jgi:hypothetical protein
MEPRFGLLDFFPSILSDIRCEGVTVEAINNLLLEYITTSKSNSVIATLIRALVETQQQLIVNYVKYSGGES